MSRPRCPCQCGCCRRIHGKARKYSKAFYRSRLASDLCIDCGEQPHELNRVRCAPCAETKRVKSKRYRLRKAIARWTKRMARRAYRLKKKGGPVSQGRPDTSPVAR